MSYITTSSGKHFDPLNPIEADIDIKDICHALSLICRANGHLKYFFSVAQHSINCCLEAKARGYSSRVQLACLLHDAAEAYMSDMIRPLKESMQEYQKFEDMLLRQIWKKYLNQELSVEEEHMVFEIDDDMLAFEFLKLMPESISSRYEKLISTPDITCKNPLEIEEKMLKMFASYQ